MNARLLINGLIAAVMFAYPAVVYFGLQYFSLNTVVGVLACLLLLRACLAVGAIQVKFMMWPTLMAVACILVLALVLKSHVPMLYYPVAMNVVMLVVFGYSLFKKPSMIERLARLREPELPPKAVTYTKKVTWVWTLFFVVNGAVATVTAYEGDLAIWTLYNGCIAYLLMGGLFGAEWLVRQKVKRAHHDT